MPIWSDFDSDAEFVAAMQSALPLINTNKTTLGMTAQQVTDLTTLCNTYIANYNAATTAKAAAKAAVSSKNSSRKTATNSMFSYVKAWRANQAVPDSLLAQLFCAPHNSNPTHNPPTTVTELVALAGGTGEIELKWKRGNNKSGTQFVVERRSSATADWDFAGVTTKSTFASESTPGQYVAFRVISVRSGKTSAPTAPVILWDNGSSTTLKIAA
jgi:hypothetical protein